VRCIRAQTARWQQKQRLIMKAVGRGVVLVHPTSADGEPAPSLAPTKAELDRANSEREAGLRAAAAAEFANAQPHPAIALAARAHPPTNMGFLGIVRIGAPMRTMPACDMFATDDTRTCRVELSLDDSADPLISLEASPFVMMAAMGAISVPPHASILLRVEQQPWLRFAYARADHGVLTALLLATEGGDGALRYLRKRYGKETRKDGDAREWTLPGLHISYAPPAIAKVPEMPWAAPAEHSCVDWTNCTRQDEVQADQASQIATGLGNAMLAIPMSKAATTPNLIVEVTPVDDATPPSAPAMPAAPASK
jgi:hypothetical protein